MLPQSHDLYLSAARNSHDWQTDFDSVEVGVRLDIGVSNDKRFFVNEITRWYGADFFCMTTIGPRTRRFAVRMRQHFMNILRDSSRLPTSASSFSQAKRPLP